MTTRHHIEMLQALPYNTICNFNPLENYGKHVGPYNAICNFNPLENFVASVDNFKLCAQTCDLKHQFMVREGPNPQLLPFSHKRKGMTILYRIVSPDFWKSVNVWISSSCSDLDWCTNSHRYSISVKERLNVILKCLPKWWCHCLANQQ